MLNPILSIPKFLFTYLVLWLLVGITHLLWLTNNYNFDIQLCLAESLIFNGLYAILGLFAGYSLFFIKDKKQSVLNILLNHTALALIITLFWLQIGIYLLELFFSNQPAYFLFLKKTYMLRFISGIFYFLFVVFAYYLIDYSRELDEKNENQKNLELAVQEAELKALKSQINPHFLFNSLNSISYLTLSEPDKAHSMILKLSDYLRYSISNSQNKMVKFSDELKNINRYLEIEKIRFGARLNYVVNMNSELSDLLIPNMILQPLYENAIKYGVHESLEPITIQTSCKFFEGFLLLEISNNFDLDSYTTKKGEGVGLENIKERLFLTYRQDNLLQVEKKQNIFFVRLSIPQNTKLA